MESGQMEYNNFLGAESCPCKKTDCPRYRLCDTCRVYHYRKRKKPFCERKKYLRRRKIMTEISVHE